MNRLHEDTLHRVQDKLLADSSPVSSERRSNSRSTADSFRSGVLGGVVSRRTTRRTVSWMCDSPVSGDDLPDDAPNSLMSRGSLPRCAVVNFCREGDVVRWTPRARENTGGMAARVRDFDDAFQLEELSSRTFGLSGNFRRRRRQQQNNVFDNDNHFDISAALAAAAHAGLEAPVPVQNPTPVRKRRSAWRRFARVFAARKTKQVEDEQPQLTYERNVQRVSLSMGNIRFTRHTKAETHATIGEWNAVEKKQPLRRPRIFTRRTAARNDLALFDPDSVLFSTKTPRRARWWRRGRARNTSAAGRAMQPDRRRAPPDPYIEFMDDEF